MFTIKNQIESYIFQQLIIKNYDKFKLFHQIYFTTTLSTSNSFKTFLHIGEQQPELFQSNEIQQQNNARRKCKLQTA